MTLVRDILTVAHAEAFQTRARLRLRRIAMVLAQDVGHHIVLRPEKAVERGAGDTRCMAQGTDADLGIRLSLHERKQGACNGTLGRERFFVAATVHRHFTTIL